MPTTLPFTCLLGIGDIPQPAKAVGAHLAAKLHLFHTDERTLTDELCDMLCIWLGMQAGSSTVHSFSLTLSKTTALEEVKNGADLRLIISSPLGQKYCLIQAKVLDPTTGNLRCDTKAGWKKLRKQLINARDEAKDLAFLLVYVPRKLLNGDNYGYGTYEQEAHTPTSGTIPAYFGATLIPVDALLSPSGRWRSTKLKVPQISPGQFKAGVPLWRALLELLLCKRSTWIESSSMTKVRDGIPAFRTLSVSAGQIEPDMWMELQSKSDQYLPPENLGN